MEKLPTPCEKVLFIDEAGKYKVGEMHYGPGKGPWRQFEFQGGFEPVRWAPLPQADDKRWRPYNDDTVEKEDVLCIGKYCDDTDGINIHIDSKHVQTFPGFAGSLPPMWGVSYWMPLEEAIKESFKIPQHYRDLPTQNEVLKKEKKEEQDLLVESVFLAIVNDGHMYKKHFSRPCDGEWIRLPSRGQRQLFQWRTDDPYGFRKWMMKIVTDYNDKYELFENNRIICERVAEDLLDHYEQIAIETLAQKA